MPFSYPNVPHQRRHGPSYGSLPPYREWLRDEFAFRCIYCLHRERWGRVVGEFDIEHWIAQVNDPTRGLDYDNLFYACHSCNLLKGDRPLPDPSRHLTAGSDYVDPIDGRIVGRTPEAEQIIETLAIDSPRWRLWRLTILRCVELAESHDRELHRLLLGFPSDLPDLASLKPLSNSRPEGIDESWFARAKRGELPERY